MPEIPAEAVQPLEIRDAPDGWTSADRDTIHRARTDGGLRATIARALWNRPYQPGGEAQIGGYVYEIADKVASALTEAAGERSAPASVQTAPQSTEAGEKAVARDVGSTDDPTGLETPTALRGRIAKALFDFIVATPHAAEHDLADVALAVRDDELAQLRARVSDYENTITWFTTCHGCAALLDASYAETRRAEQAEAAIARVRQLSEQWAALAPADDWGDSITGTLSSDHGRAILAALDGPAEQTGGDDE